MTTAEHIAKLLNDFNERLVVLKKAYADLDNVLLGQGYIVTCATLGVGFDIEGMSVRNPFITDILKAPRFTKDDAKRLARTVRNGAGETGTAIHIRFAIKAAIESLEDSIAAVQRAAEAQAA